jgi:hypothetical protein
MWHTFFAKAEHSFTSVLSSAQDKVKVRRCCNKGQGHAGFQLHCDARIRQLSVYQFSADKKRLKLAMIMP